MTHLRTILAAILICPALAACGNDDPSGPDDVTGDKADNDEHFQLCGHEASTDYSTAYITPDTILRTYGDGWSLEFDLDEDERSIPESYRWIETGPMSCELVSKLSFFQWCGYQDRSDYTQKMVNNMGTICREYADGSKLLFDLDEDERSIPESYRWVCACDDP